MEDLRSTTVSDDPVQRRDLILLERARVATSMHSTTSSCSTRIVFALVVRMVPDRDQASDCVQEAFFSAYRNLTSFRGGSVKVVAQPDLRQRRDGHAARQEAATRPAVPRVRRREPAATGARGRSGADGDALGTDRALAGALAGITDDQRSAIVLYDIEGYDYAEIAEMTGVSLDRQVADPSRPARPARPAR